MLAADDHLRVHHDEAGEEEGANPGVEGVQGLGAEPDHEEAEDDEGEEEGHQHARADGEVNLGLARKDGQADGDAHADAEGNQHLVRVVEGGYHTNQVGCKSQVKWSQQR